MMLIDVEFERASQKENLQMSCSKLNGVASKTLDTAGFLSNYSKSR